MVGAHPFRSTWEGVQAFPGKSEKQKHVPDLRESQQRHTENMADGGVSQQDSRGIEDTNGDSPELERVGLSAEGSCLIDWL